MKSVRAVLIGLSLAVPAVATAGKGVDAPAREVVGAGTAMKIEPDLERATRTADGYVWSRTVLIPKASFLKVHFVDVNLRPGDRLVLRTHTGRVIETITGLGPKDRGTFWGLSSPGDAVVVEFHFAARYDRLPFRVDQVIAGEQGLFGTGVEAGQRSICSPADFEDAICYENDAGKWANVQASVGVMSVGGSPTSALFCSGSNVSPQNYVLTNNHCIENQAQCNGAEYVFRYYRTGCNDGSQPTLDWQSFRCDEVVAFEPFINCDAGPGDLDFTLTSIIGDAASTFGYVEPDATPLTSGEDIYIVQHPDGRPHEITLGGGADVVVDGSVLRYYDTLDTEGGSSGSPVFRTSDNKLVGLHHCGGCSSPGIGNRGMLMSDILPLIEPFVCTDTVTLAAAASDGLTEVVGNGDGVLDPGETWQFVPSVRNAACALDATGVTATLAASGAGVPVTLLSSTASFGDIAAGQAASAAPVAFRIDGTAACGGEVIIDLVSIDSDGVAFAGSDDYLVADVGAEALETIYLDTFDGGLAAWTIQDGGSGAGAAATWTTTNPGGRTLGLTAPFAIADSDEHGSVNTMDEALISPIIDATGFSDSVTLNFDHDFTWYTGGQDEQADVQVRSAATGGAWTTIANYSGGNTSGFVTLDLTPYAATDLQLRFRYYDAAWEWWWAIDNVTVRGSDGFTCNAADSDGDGVTDDTDNCTDVINADQRDTNGDGYGNACDADINNDGVINFGDLAVLKAVFLTATPDADFDGDGQVNFGDLAQMKASFLGSPGPSQVAP